MNKSLTTHCIKAEWSDFSYFLRIIYNIRHRTRTVPAATEEAWSVRQWQFRI